MIRKNRNLPTQPKPAKPAPIRLKLRLKPLYFRTPKPPPLPDTAPLKDRF